jgi:hypothetical protein
LLLCALEGRGEAEAVKLKMALEIQGVVRPISYLTHALLGIKYNICFVKLSKCMVWPGLPQEATLMPFFLFILTYAKTIPGFFILQLFNHQFQ